MPAVNTNISIGFSISVSGVEISTDFDYNQNVKKRIANILYLNDPPPDAVLLAYAGSEEITVDNSLFIGDRSDKLYPNSRNTVDSEFIYYYSPAPVQHGNLLVTAKFTTSNASEIPLYFKHVLDSTVQIDTIKILDKNFNDIDEDKYLIEPIYEYNESLGNIIEPYNILSINIYNSLESYFDYNNGEYEVYYLQYRDANNDTLTVLLDNELAYHEATMDDIWSATGLLAPWSTAYIINQVNNSYEVRVPAAVGSNTTKFAVKYTSASKIYIDKPIINNNKSLWMPRVSNGSFSWKYGGYSYLYNIPEFASQSFNPIDPYKLSSRSESIKINKNLLKLPHEDIAIGGLFQYFSLLIYKDDKLEYALTEDITKVGSRYKDYDGKYVTDSNDDIIEWNNDKIISIDRRAGIVQLSIDLKDYWNYYSTYNYKEKFYTVSSMNMNPIFNPEVHKQIKTIYIVPKAQALGNSGSQVGSVNYITTVPDGTIESTSQNGQSDGHIELTQDLNTMIYDADGSKIKGYKGLHYSWRASSYITNDCVIDSSQNIPVESTKYFPKTGWIRIKNNNGYWRYAKYTDKTNTSLIISDDNDGSGGSLGEVPVSVTITLTPGEFRIVEVVNFIDEFTTLSNRNVNDEINSYDKSGKPNCFNRLFILADMTINPPHGVNEMTLLDTREEGGNLRSDKYEEAKFIQPEAQWYYDYIKYDGQPHPGNAAVVIKLPIDLLDTFTEDQIEEIINNNIPFGVKPLIRYYGYKPRIISISTEIEPEGFGNDSFGEHEFGE